MISAVYVTLNETEKLKKSISSLANFVEEIVILDLGSSDGLEELKKDKRVKIFTHPKVLYVEKVRNLSIQKASGDWVIVLDPDEQLSETLIEKLKEVYSSKRVNAVNIPRKNIFFGSWIAHTNFWPDKHIRFFQKDKIDWPDKIHTNPKIDGETLSLPAKPELAIIHYGYDSHRQFIVRQERYAKMDAKNRLDRGESFSLINLFWLPIREFLVRLIKNQGYLDGVNGIFLVVFLMYYQILVQVNMLTKK